jgi:hypothetical protein
MGIQVNTSKVDSIDVIKNKAIMVCLNRKKLNRNRIDKDISIEVKDLKKVSENGAIRVNKSIFPKACTDPYGKIYNEASKYFYRCTLPWDDKGWRLLSIDMFKEFTKRFKKYTRDYREQVNIFIDKVEDHIEEAKNLLGDAFKQEDYTFIADNGQINRQLLEDQFSLEVEFNTVTGGDDLRATLTEADREAVAADIDAKAMAKFAKSQEHIVHGLVDCIGSIHERLSQEENIFRDTLIPNLEDLCDLVPKMNIGGDPAINELAAEAKAKLCKWDCQTLRDDSKRRKEVSKEADAILSKAEGLL